MMSSLLGRSFMIASLALIGVILLVYGAGILIPLAVAVLFWMFINALADMYQRLWSAWFGPLRFLALGLAFLTLLIASLAIAQIIAVNLAEISARTPDFQRSIGLLLDEVARYTGISNEEIVSTIVERFNLQRLLTAIVLGATGIASHVGVVFVYVIFLLVEQQFFDVKLNALLPDKGRRERVRSMLLRVAQDVQTYLWTMSIVSLLTAALSYIVLALAGVDSAAFWAFLIFILNFIPTIGSILATAIVSLYALLQFGTFSSFLVVVVSIGIIQFVIGNIVQPRMTAKSLNLSQFVVILALFAWGAMWGVVGMFLAVPLTAVAMIICSNFPETRSIAVVLSESGDLGSAEN